MNLEGNGSSEDANASESVCWLRVKNILCIVAVLRRIMISEV